MAKYFVYPFGVAGDKTAIPNPTTIDGSVSYQSGFPIDYEKDLLTDPDALPIPRDQFNQLMFDTTGGIQQYQQNGVPDWVAAADNLAVPLPYPLFARVRYDAGGGVQIYENQVVNNTATPGADNTWIVISGNLTGVLTGAVIEYGGVVVPTGYLNCIGAAVSRTTFAALIAAITFVQSGITTASSASVTGLTDTTLMYIGMPLEGAGIQAGSTVLTIPTGTSITMSLTATASATVNIQFFPHGNGNGSTTFNVPDYRRRTAVGSGGSASADPLGIGNVIGQKGGEESHVQTELELASHNHPGSVFSVNAPTGAPAGSTGAQVNPSGGSTQAANIAIDGNSNAANIIQPSIIMMKAIKY